MNPLHDEVPTRGTTQLVLRELRMVYGPGMAEKLKQTILALSLGMYAPPIALKE